MILLATVSALGVGLGVIISVMTLVLLAGLLAGQFRRGVVEELRSSLSAAVDEIDIARGRADRLEREAIQLRMEVTNLRMEVETLRKVVVDERKIAATVAEALKETEAMAKQEAVDAVVKVVTQGNHYLFEKLDGLDKKLEALKGQR